MKNTIQYFTTFIVSPLYIDVFMLRCKLRVTSYWLSHTFRGSKQNASMNIGKTTYTTAELLKECKIQHPPLKEKNISVQSLISNRNRPLK